MFGHVIVNDMLWSLQEPLENLDSHHVLDIETDGKLHVLYGGTKVVQHTPPSKTGPGMKSKQSNKMLSVTDWE